ncbi:MAG: flavin reductase family protein [Chloroflexi bacterium]|nr:flavin reductase family protein [Chloroflexota bacterium]
MSITQDRFRQALGRFASGVTVVTTHEAGVPLGLTVSSFASLSLDPPLVLVAIDRRVRANVVIGETGAFAVNILTAAQESLSRQFATREIDRFAGVTWQPGAALGLPLLDGALAQLECRLHQTLPGGDHTIFVGEVVAAELGDAAPLLYFRSAYRGLA